MRLNAKQIAEYCAATVLVDALDPSRLAEGITWDSREVKPGMVYVALPGNKVDGHSFVDDALRSGAVVVLVMQPPSDTTCLLAKEMGTAILEVASTFTAFTDLARAWRNHLRATIVAITGSTGKTTTKNLVRDVLSTTYSVVATRGNQNNELGVPRTLLEANPENEYVVLEMGMQAFGELEDLCEFAKPDITLVTNVGESHIELLGSRDNIARAKAEAVAALPVGNGKAILNAADERTPLICETAQVDKRGIALYYYDGSGNAASDSYAYATDIKLDAQGRPSFTLHIDGRSHACHLSLRGLHNVSNSCAAAALGSICHVSDERILEGIEKCLPEVGRQDVEVSPQGVTVINDAYNASPDSMRASLAMFSSLSVKGKRYAVLGDMGELGDFAQSCHEGIGEIIPTFSLDYLICVGELAQYIAQAAQKAGFSQDRIFTTNSRVDALAELEARLEEGDAVLVKASHSMELDRVVRGLLN